MKRILFVFISLISATVFTQDPEFTQFYSNPVYLNPALAGSGGCPRLNLNYRNQWPNLSGAFVTNSVSYDQFVQPLHGGIAIMVTNDAAGKNTLNWSTINLIYSYHLKLSNRFSLLFGGQATWNQKFLDWGKLTFGDQLDPQTGFIYTSGDLPSGKLYGKNNSWTTRGIFDVSAGIAGYGEYVYFGFAAKHLNQPEQSLTLRGDGNSVLPIRYTAHIGATIPFEGRSYYESKTSISPNIIYTYQDGFMQTNIGTYIQHGAFTTGVWWRAGDAFILTAGVDAGTFRFGYSYDVTISRLTNASGGSHELSLGFTFACKQPEKIYRTISCPSF